MNVKRELLDKGVLLQTTFEAIIDPNVPEEYKQHLKFMYELISTIQPIEVTILNSGGAIVNSASECHPEHIWKITGERIGRSPVDSEIQDILNEVEP